MWIPQISALESEFHALAIDLPGHGRIIDKPFTLDSAVKEVAQCIELETTGKAIIVGLSLGGYVAIAHANKHPEQISGLILSGCCVQYLGLMGLTAKLNAVLSKIVSQRHFETRQKEMLRKVTSSNIVDEICKKNISLKGSRESMEEVIGKNFVQMLKSCDVPVFLVNGENDTFNRKYESKLLVGAGNVSLEIIKDSGHLCSLENPVVFSNLVRDFANGIHA
ncbi:hypothetical protein MNBD_NITROSPINAE03-1735 [hydrothermal vent metagenome]|uniref:Serine aminopeptidase S33 domain-containing protein n=1 Tax=hydrothermal vent metagenome TaxID=652676 RepID=A0A3B1CLN6_9ZZZZ